MLNTCAVTAQAERTARAYLRRIRRQNPAAQILITGCYAQRAPQELARLAGVDAVVGNSHKAWVPALARELATSGPPCHPQTANPILSTKVVTLPGAGFLALSDFANAAGAPVFADDAFAHANLAAGDLATVAGTRPNLKVQDGCGNRCSFCIIPTTRGGSRSVPLPTVMERVRAFVAAEGKELVLSGINLGRWGLDLARSMRLEQLVAAILEQTSLPRLRISSIEPMDWSPELISLFRRYARNDASSTGPRLARHAHLPLQSGADGILRAMHRRYRPWHYAEKLAAIALAIPEAALGADLMVGFPGETDALFEESYRFVEDSPLTYLHLFPFSARPGTSAWTQAQQQPVSGEAVKQRMTRLRGLMEARQAAGRQRMEGERLSVITLKASSEQKARGVAPAISDTFVPIELDGSIAGNQMLWVRVNKHQAPGTRLSAAVIPT